MDLPIGPDTSTLEINTPCCRPPLFISRLPTPTPHLKPFGIFSSRMELCRYDFRFFFKLKTFERKCGPANSKSGGVTRGTTRWSSGHSPASGPPGEQGISGPAAAILEHGMRWGRG
ncbi:hypothetical protein JTE90_000920 [Oedothorax gibbosus]|uniref:Uncharacterized protein n=1 Tax=Oedothorax gibbosus TaxID=931172 RepID=A0AAV6VVP3_9ARAC|nr:hypothetical protein JTE90_000920 [Oedothorax gibbosus]